jgi:hypothetical protein
MRMAIPAIEAFGARIGAKFPRNRPLRQEQIGKNDPKFHGPKTSNTAADVRHNLLK